MSKKTGAGLADYARAQLGKPYWWGTFGQIATAALLAQKREQYPDSYRGSQYPSQYGQRVHDCVGLIKGYRWSETPDSPPQYVAAQDVGVSGLYRQCSRQGPISTIPDQPGVCVFMGAMGHVGVYIGGGKVIEAMGQDYGVVETDLRTRGWAYWGMPDWIDYSTQEETQTTTEPEQAAQEEPTPPVRETTAAYTYTMQLPLLRIGSKGEAVRAAQALLIDKGYRCGQWGADGDFGPDTKASVMRYQRSRGLETDGVIGGETWSSLLGL